MTVKAVRPTLGEENERLRARVVELEETLRAIRSGDVDALIVQTAGQDQVFTLKSADLTYRLMVEQMANGAASLSADGMVLYCNPFLAALLDVPVASLLGAPLSGFVDEHEAITLGGLLRTTAEDGVSRGEVSFRRRAESVLTHVSLTMLSLDGEPPVFSMIVTDLTERKRRDEERMQLHLAQAAQAKAEDANSVARADIERRKWVEESLRRAETERSELLALERTARTEAEEANRLKDEFLATLSHELRSPINAIVAWAHILGEPGLDAPTATRAVQAIDRNARAQTQLIADILDVSRIVTGKFHLSLGPVQLCDVIEAAADTVRPAAQARDIRLELALDPATRPVSGDASRLQQVVWNLLSNAMKFAPAGGRVEVRLEEVGACIELTVQDDGPGIDPAFLPYVFDRFRQADSSSTRSHGGLGLGLAIVRHLVELHGGTVEACNRTDQKGAVLIVRLPRQQRAGTDGAWTEPQAPDEPPEPEMRSAPLLLQGVSVLIVDDEEDAREAMAIGLRRQGARVITASSANEAVAVLVRERPQVLVTDIGMAGEDGYALLRKVRTLPFEQGGATPAIALTGYANQQDRVDALRAGFHMHVPKPLTPAELAAAVASLVAPLSRADAAS
jgi:PAS domain S-box-containing protein